MTVRLTSPDVDVVYSGNGIQDVYVKISPTIELIYQADCIQWIVRQTCLKGFHVSHSTFKRLIDAVRWANLLMEDDNGIL